MEFSAEEKKQYKSILLKTLKAFDSFCSEHSIKYYAAYGTAIGAIRHKGVIPWDDDIDVVMIREDYEKFLSLKSKLIGTAYRIIDPSDENYYLPYAKFTDTTTTLWEVEEYEFVIGVFIDIFPLDHETGSIKSIRKNSQKYRKICKRLYGGYENLTCNFSISKFLRHPGLFVTWLKKLLFYRPLRRLNKRIFVKYYNKFKEKNCGEWLINYYAPYSVERELLRSEWFETQLRVPFEDTSINIMGEYHNYLTFLYGDYMTPPPLDLQNSHHFHYFYDLNQGLSIQEAKQIIQTKA